MIKIGELKMSLWNELEEMFETSGNSIKVYNAKVKTSGVIEKIGVTTNSVLGCIIYNLEFLLVDNWVRVIGRRKETA